MKTSLCQREGARTRESKGARARVCEREKGKKNLVFGREEQEREGGEERERAQERERERKGGGGGGQRESGRDRQIDRASERASERARERERERNRESVYGLLYIQVQRCVSVDKIQICTTL